MIEFDRAAARAGFTLDEAQRRVAQRLARLGSEVRRRGRFSRAPRGVHLWGPVGRGKSWLTTVLFDTLRTGRERRVHFHDFFRRFHAAYGRHRRERNAVDRAVEELLGGVRFLCFDEFHVHDPGDAMLIARLLRSLFARRTTLLTTSNHPLDDLLPNPLHHHLFEPTIALLKAGLDVVELRGDRDYRTLRPDRPRSAFERGRYLWPGTEDQLRAAALTPPTTAESRLLEVGGRLIRAAAVRGDLVWFTFRDLCATPTSTADYLAIAERHPTWVLSDVPVLGPPDREPAQRFANLVDVLCDRDAHLTVTAAGPPDRVLRGAPLPLDVDRTLSRLALLAP